MHRAVLKECALIVLIKTLPCGIVPSAARVGNMVKLCSFSLIVKEYKIATLTQQIDPSNKIRLPSSFWIRKIDRLEA